MLQVRARSFVSAHPHFVRVRAYTLDRCSTLDPHFAQVRAWHPNHRLMLPVRARPFCECPVRARSFERGPSLRSGPGLTFLTWLNASSPGTIFCECPPPRSFAALYGAAAVAQQVLGSRRRRRALGRARGRARPNPAGCGEVTSPLLSITSILNATSYESVRFRSGAILFSFHVSRLIIITTSYCTTTPGDVLVVQDFSGRLYKCVQEIKMLPDSISSFINDHLESFVLELAQFLSIPSVSTLSEHEKDVVSAAEWVLDQVKRCGFTGRVYPTERHPIVLARSPEVPGAPALLIYGHYDVQPPDPLDEWQTPPFSPDVRDGYIYARGATDDKGQFF